MLNQTICAISTPIGNGGISVVRMSGTKSKDILQKLITFDVLTMEDRKMYLTTIKTENFLEQALVVCFFAPNSYTGEDVVEIQCHGGVQIAKGILNELLKCGGVLAEAGEFTKRAFINGKLSLEQAEGVIDMINAESDLAVKAGYNLLSGKLFEKVKEMQNNLTLVQAQIEVALDYPDQDLEFSTTQQIKEKLTQTLNSLIELIKTAQTGMQIKDGINVLILGKPNVGKSSLLNAMLGFDRAIVTDVPGTTRDTLEEFYSFSGINFKVTDTAGIRESDNEVEKIGIFRAKQAIEVADIILAVLDLSKPLEDEDKSLLNLVKNKCVLYVLNKSDLNKKMFETFRPNITISAIKQENIEKLKQKIYDTVIDKNMLNSQILITNLRHLEILKNTKICLENAVDEIDKNESLDLIALDTKSAWVSLGEITGETSTEKIIDTIFSKFCLGK